MGSIQGCGTKSSSPPERPVPTVTVSEVVEWETVAYDIFTGRTEASEIVEVRPRVFGYLQSIEFQDGDFVEEGQRLFLIEPDTYDAIHQQSLARQHLLEAKSQLADANFARRNQLFESGAANLEEFQEATAAAAEAKAAVEAAKADSNRTAVDLRYTEIKAPISGRIDRAYVTRGNLVQGGESSGTLLTRIVREQPMYVYFDVDERSLLRYMRMRTDNREETPGNLRTLGIPCAVQLTDETTFPHLGELDFLSSQVESGTGTARLRAVFPNLERNLVSGLFVRVRIPTGPPYSARLVPEQAISRDQSTRFVYVLDEQETVARRSVTLGESLGEFRIITEGLEPGELVIVRGLQRVREGDRVQFERETMDLESIESSAAEPADTAQPPDEANTTTSEEQ
jgi:RND family efflux transporter MFP subunit